MRILVAAAFLWWALPVASQEPVVTADVLRQALRALPQHIRGLEHHALPNGDDMHQYAIADLTVGGAEKSFSMSATKLYGSSSADELLASYKQVTQEGTRIDATDGAGMRVLPLDDYATGRSTYDWSRLLERYPDVKAIVRVSPAATANGDALVRFEMISPDGALWGNFIALERQIDGTWKHTRAVAGSLWN